MLTTQKQVRAAFWESYPVWTLADGFRGLRSRGNGKQNDYPPDTRCAFVDFVDMLARDGDISESLAQRVTL